MQENERIEEILKSLSDEKDKEVEEFEFVFGSDPGEQTPDDSSETKLSFVAEFEDNTTFEITSFDKPSESEKTSAPQPLDAPSVLNVAYMPKFTGASDYYAISPTKKEVKSKNAFTETKNIDPTAEIYAEDDRGATINVRPMSASDELGSESSSKVFKFANDSDTEDCENAQPEIPAAEEVETLFASCEEVSLQPLDTEDKEYVIPDPVEKSSALDVYETTAMAVGSTQGAFPKADKVGDGEVERSNEYTSYAQRDSFKDKFLDSIMSLRIRFFVALAFTLLIIGFEAAYAFGADIPSLLGLETFRGVSALIDMQLVICVYLLAIPETVGAIRRLYSGRLTTEIMLTLSFIISLGYNIFCTVYQPREYALFGVLFAIPALVAIISAYLRKSADFTVFKIIATEDEKFVVDKKFTRTLDNENMALDGIVEEHKSKTARLFRTSFVSNFFKRSKKTNENSKNITFILGCSFILALGTGAVAFLVPGGVSSAVTAFSLVFLIANPAMSILLHKASYYCFTRNGAKKGNAVIGDASLLDYSGIDVITFEDVEVFGQDDVTLQTVALYGGNNDPTKALRQMSALFMNVGGPLDCLFSNALDRKCDPARNTFIEDFGVGGDIGEHKVLAGSKEYMLSKGVVMPADESLSTDRRLESTRVMYAAEDGVVYAKFYIRYSFSEEFTMLMINLEDEGITPLIYTRDPNLTSEVVRTLTAGADKIRVMKKYTLPEGDDLLYDKISAAMITGGDKDEAIELILNTKKYAKLKHRLFSVERLCMLVGGAFGVVISLFKMWLVPSFAIALWQITFSLVCYFMSAKAFPSKNKKGN